MIIECPACSKKFNIDEKLIPDEGRLLKCGNCDHTWFYKKEDNLKLETGEEITDIDLIDNNKDLILLTGNHRDFFGKLFQANKLKNFEKIISLLKKSFLFSSAFFFVKCMKFLY